MSAKERLIKFVDKMGMTKNEFTSRAGLANGYLNSARNISSDSLKKISKAFIDLNLYWVIMGKGSMLRSERETNVDGILKTIKIIQDQLKEDFPSNPDKDEDSIQNLKKIIIEQIHTERALYLALELSGNVSKSKDRIIEEKDKRIEELEKYNKSLEEQLKNIGDK